LGDSPFNICDINVEGGEINVTKYRLRPRIFNGIGRRHKRERGQKHFVTWTDAEGQQRKVKRSSAGGSGDRKLCAGKFSKAPFKFRHLRALNHPSTLQGSNGLPLPLLQIRFRDGIFILNP
jgi:hypothetical protein